MSLFDSIFDYLKKRKHDKSVPKGYCPNCWGYQEYEGKFLNTLQKENIDLNNLKEKKGWIQEYAIKHFEGIKLKETDDLFECPNCKLAYRHS